MTFPQIMSSERTRLIVITLLTGCAAFILFAVYWHFRATKIPPEVLMTSPVREEDGVPVNTKISVVFHDAILPASLRNSNFVLRDAQNQLVPTTITYLPASHTAILTPNSPLAVAQRYEVLVAGGFKGIHDSHGNRLGKSYQWTFYTASMKNSPPITGAGGPILIVASQKNPFSFYYTEILRTEGFNEFQAKNITAIDEAALQQADLAIVGEIPLTQEQSDMLVAWVRNGGSLIAMRPDPNLARRLNLKDTGQQLKNGYVAIDTSAPPGKGLTSETMQFHGDADMYMLNGGSRVATLYRSASTSASAPAVVIETIGAGKAAVFAYDLARSVIYTRQGNPAWAGMERDGLTPMRSDDLFFGAAPLDPQPDWVDFSKITIPQADEQQRLLAHLILMLTYGKEPLPRFSYFPHGYKAVVIMTGDDHGGAGTAGRFRRFVADSRPGCSVADWQCIRSTSNIFLGSIKPEDATRYVAQGFEIGLHVSTSCKDWPTEKQQTPDGKVVTTIVPDAMDSYYSNQLVNFASMYPGIQSPVTTRTDCIAWGDYDTQPQVELKYGIRLDTNYYYWPPNWVKNQPGMFTGSGMPMRFAKTDGTLIDVYQAATQMTDESGQSYPFTIDKLLDNAVGPKEYFGVFTANMHTDNPESDGANAIVVSAKARGVPVIAANQMLKWLDGRDASYFQNLKWTGQALEFQIYVGVGANGLQAQLPFHSMSGALTKLTWNDQPAKYAERTIKGIDYAIFAALPGNYIATYENSGK